MEIAADKLAWLSGRGLAGAQMQALVPDRKHDWLNQMENDWESFVPLVDPDERHSIKGRSIFSLFSRGVGTYRDEWVYAWDRPTLTSKLRLLIDSYENVRAAPDRMAGSSVKWDADLEKNLKRGTQLHFDPKKITSTAFRPFVRRDLYFDKILNGRTYQIASIIGGSNRIISFLGMASSNPLAVLAIDRAYDLCLLKNGNGGTQGVPRFRYLGADRLDNITDWALEQFTAHYGPKSPITRDDIFHYVYAVLHDPVYRETYALNLRREFPRIPFYSDFARWATWGKALMDLHIGYEAVEPWPLKRIDLSMRGGELLKRGKSKDLFEKSADPSAKREADAPKPRLKADKDNGIIELDTQTQLSGVPPEAWTYRLGNRSALEWVLDQHKEKKPSDPTIREKFDTYRFADHKERVIDLLGRVTRVSVETVAITEAMRALPASARETVRKQAAE
jgi:predicted helicase